MTVRLCLFGPPRVAQHGGAMALPFERRSQLLAHLALRRSGVARNELAALLWPDTSAEQAHTNLRKTLFRLRDAPWSPAIVAHEQSLAFDGTTDVADFEAAIAQGRWTDALEIADDSLLAGFDDDASAPWSRWLRAERQRLRSAWWEAAEHCLAAADPADALALSTRLLTIDPLHEAALRAQMRAYAQLGRPARAREVYHRHAAQLADSTGCTPSAELQALHDALGAPANAALPAVHGAGDAPRIIGRAIERRTVRLHLEAGHRVLSLVGPGGVGKSCLAQHLCSELAPHYADSAVYVPLDDVPTADGLGARLARELAVDSRMADPLQAAIAWLSGRRTLLVLDNFEHMLPAAPQLQQLLDACPRVQLLVTSRVRLGLASERLLPLDGLPCPAPEDSDYLEAFDAARLFVRAAQAVAPALQPAREASAIAEICRLVDGMPLALEIAAAWTRVLPCETIACELRRDIGLLTHSDAARPARHASMAAVFEQSWQRLTGAERKTWACLAVFHGGFTLDAARAVVDATLPVLAALTDQSLLRKTGSRFDLHPLLRQLVAERLTADERQAGGAVHATYYLSWLGRLRDELNKGDKETLQQVELELENVRAAWRWGSVHGPALALKPAAVPLMLFFDMRGRIAEGLALQREAVAGIGGGDTVLGPLLDATSAHFKYCQGRHQEAQDLAERALLAARATQDVATRRLAFKVSGCSAIALGSMQVARRRFRQALAEASRAGDPHGAAALAQSLSIAEGELGRYDAARALLERALADHRRLGTPFLEALCLNNLATLEMQVGQFDAAGAHLERALSLCEGDAFMRIKAAVLLTTVELAVHRCDAAAAQRHGRAASELVRRMGTRDMQCWLQLQMAQAAVQQGDMAAARAALRSAVEDAIELPAPQQVACVSCFAQLLHAQREPAVAIRLLRYAMDHPAADITARNRTQHCLAEWSSSQPDADALQPPAVDLHALLLRIAAETPTAHAALIDSLRGMA